MESIELLSCNGCYGDFTESDINSDSYCFGCSYEKAAKLDNLTGVNDE